MSASGSDRQRGVTLIELMVVVAIVGIVAGLSLKSFRTDEAGTDARHVASQMSAAYRIAIGGGAVRPDVVAVTPALQIPTARARLEITTDAGVNVVRVWKRVEDNLPAHTYQWVYVTGTYLSDETSVAGVDTVAALTPTGTTPPAPAFPVYVYYYPNGSADSVTTFLENRYGNGKRYRVVGLPLVPAPQVFIDW